MLADSQPWLQWSWVTQNWSTIQAALIQHVQLAFLAIGIGLVISMPTSVLIVRRRRAQGAVYGVTGALFAIPSLGLFGFLIPITGLSTLTAEIGLVSYTLLILVRNIVTGIEAVPAEVRDAADGMGFSTLRRVLTVEVPIALPAIIAGIRIASVTTIGLVTVVAVVGLGGGLGELIMEGFQQNLFKTEIVVGAALSVLLALAADGVFVILQRAVTPWARAGGGDG